MATPNMPAILPFAWARQALARLPAVARGGLGERARDARPARRPNQRGVTIVEFALVLPLLVILMFLVIDFGIYFFAQHTIQFATREGARLALVGRTLSDPNGQPLSREASVVKKIQDSAAIVIPANRLQISVYPVEPGLTDPKGWENMQDAGLPGSYMRVRSRYQYKFITPFLGALVKDGNLPVTAQATYRNEFFN
jgi:hypothetical protein